MPGRPTTVPAPTVPTTGGGAANGAVSPRWRPPTCPAATDYIAATYAGATVERAGKAEENQFIVHIRKADGTHAALFFEADGTFVSEKTAGDRHGTEVAVADLPGTVTAYLSSNYSGATIEKAFRDNEGNLVVVLRNADGTRVGTAFDAAGNFTREVTFSGRRGKKGPGR